MGISKPSGPYGQQYLEQLISEEVRDPGLNFGQNIKALKFAMPTEQQTEQHDHLGPALTGLLLPAVQEEVPSPNSLTAPVSDWIIT